ncbi:uncharacterized protein [Branchiostoma lanceolatum]|uniref:uncharacterized protein n=1 Tax=Branchiostoma lanceolatum TaxID=7740 RepID=UPI003451B531
MKDCGFSRHLLKEKSAIYRDRVFGKTIHRRRRQLSLPLNGARCLCDSFHSTMSSCVVCDSTVTDKQHALQCDECLGWQHRLCNSGIDHITYRRLRSGEVDIGVWACNNCRLTSTESDMDTTDPPPSVSRTENESSIEDPPEESTVEESFISNPPASPPPTFRTGNNESMEDSLEESALDLEEMEVDDQPVPRTYEVVERATKKGHSLLVDNLGYKFGVQRRLPSAVHWFCTVRPKVNPCKATVKERDGVFEAGPQEHNHAPDVGAAISAKIAARVKKEAGSDLFKSAAAIVDDVLLEELGDAPCPSLSKPVHLARAANRHRQKLRPEEPKDLDFVIDEDHVPPTFLRGDVRVRVGGTEKRHLIFATDTQLHHMSMAKTFYMDGTFKLSRAPFTQLYSISAFVKKDDCMKSVPLVFVLMSRREIRDYKKVLKKILELLPEPPKVTRAMMDFEKAMWSAMSQVLPDVTLTGCMFHWCQCVWRRIRNAGLQTAYLQKGAIHKYLKKIMSLPFLPAEEIPAEWERLRAQATTPALRIVTDYVDSTWISPSAFHPPSTWSVFKKTVRTNNDVEGWHNALNKRANGKSKLPFYLLVPRLQKEAALVALNVKLVRMRKLSRTQRKGSRIAQEKIFKEWLRYESGEKTASELLCACSHYCPDPARHLDGDTDSE